MSISTRQQNDVPGLSREAAIPKASIKKVAAKAVASLADNWLITVILVMSIITGIGEALGSKFSLGWYIIFGLDVLIFALDKFQIINHKPEEIIIKGDKPAN
jgi:hypothetical protein